MSLKAHCPAKRLNSMNKQRDKNGWIVRVVGLFMFRVSFGVSTFTTRVSANVWAITFYGQPAGRCCCCCCSRTEEQYERFGP